MDTLTFPFIVVDEAAHDDNENENDNANIYNKHIYIITTHTYNNYL